MTDNSQTSFKPNTEELMNGIAGMSLRYGVAGAGSGVVTTYKAAREMAAVDWRHVRTVRVSLLLQSQTREVDEAPKSMVFDGRTLAADSERRLRLVMSSTIALRNPPL
ncbi:MAG: PilW family protein [Pseudomonas sp.]